jgi:hypothetical protein
MHDGGSIYNLSGSPGSVIEDNYMYNNNSTVALYLDEGSRYLTVSSNVVQDAGVWAFTNANANKNTDNNTFSGNWFNVPLRWPPAHRTITSCPATSRSAAPTGHRAPSRSSARPASRTPVAGRVPVWLPPAGCRQRQPVPGRVREHDRERRGH